RYTKKNTLFFVIVRVFVCSGFQTPRSTTTKHSAPAGQETAGSTKSRRARRYTKKNTLFFVIVMVFVCSGFQTPRSTTTKHSAPAGQRLPGPRSHEEHEGTRRRIRCSS